MHSPISWVLNEKGHVVHTISPAATVCEAVRGMRNHGIGCLVVTETGRVVGLIAERDVLMRCIAAGREARYTPVRDVMTLDPPTLRPDSTVGDAMTAMTDRRTRHLPVVDGDDLVGLVSIGDLTRWMTRQLQGQVQSLESYIQGAYA